MIFNTMAMNEIYIKKISNMKYEIINKDKLIYEFVNGIVSSVGFSSFEIFLSLKYAYNYIKLFCSRCRYYI